MSTGSISNLSSSYLQQALASALQNAGITNAGSTSNTGATAAASQSPDSTQLSPFAKLASTLQQLQQSDPAKYKQVTEQVAVNLQSAAQTATSQGNTSAASQLSQLATDFTNASQSGQLPNLQDLAQAVGSSGGGHHHHHHAAAASGSASSSGAASQATTQTTSQATSQLLSSLVQTGDSQSTQSASVDPGAIILKALSDAGINVTNS